MACIDNHFASEFLTFAFATSVFSLYFHPSSCGVIPIGVADIIYLLIWFYCVIGCCMWVWPNLIFSKFYTYSHIYFIMWIDVFPQRQKSALSCINFAPPFPSIVVSFICFCYMLSYVTCVYCKHRFTFFLNIDKSW